jgi:hypothetical protein
MNATLVGAGGIALGVGLLVACTSSSPGASRGTDAGGDAASQLQWYTTCGYPVCGPFGPDAGAADAGPACAAVGSPCTAQGDTCGTPSSANCGVTLVCSSHDPKGSPGGCPISSKTYKDGIEYVSDAELRKLHDETLHVKLATYRYKPQVADPLASHLGFIIEDNPESVAVDRVHHRVDLYGYLSMLVATIQVQEKEIVDLRRELTATRHDGPVCREPQP